MVPPAQTLVSAPAETPAEVFIVSANEVEGLNPQAF